MECLKSLINTKLLSERHNKMAKENEFNPSKLMEIATQSKIGKVINLQNMSKFCCFLRISFKWVILITKNIISSFFH